MSNNQKNAENKNSKFYIYLIIAAAAASIAGFFYFIFPFNIHLDEQRGPVKIYFVEHIAAVHHNLIDEFNRIHKGKIEVVPLHYALEKFTTNERKELLSRYMRSKNAKIDILSVDIIWVPRFAKWCEPFSPKIEKMAKDSLLSYGLHTSYYNGALYAIPLHLDVGLLYYRKDILSKLPDYSEIQKRLRSSISWEELLALQKRLNVKNPYYVFQGDNFEGLVCNFIEIMSSLHENSPDAGIDLNSPEAKKAFQHLNDLVNKYKVAPYEVTHFNELLSYKYYMDNDGVFIRGWSVFRSLFKNDPEYAGKIALLEPAALPHFDGHDFKTIFGGRSLMISQASGHKEEALEFIKFLISKEAQEKLFSSGEFIPVNANVYADSAFMARNQDLKYYSGFFAHGVYRPRMEDYTRVSDIAAYYLNAVLKREITVEEAVIAADKMIRSGEVLIY